MRETFKLNFNQVENEAGSSSSSLGTSFAAIALWEQFLNNNKRYILIFTKNSRKKKEKRLFGEPNHFLAIEK